MISLAHRVIFVHIPKCGGQSVEEAFARDLGLSWDAHRRLLMCFPRPPGWPGEDGRLAHLKAREYRDHYLPRDVFSRFFKFALVRDPHRRVESHYRYGDYHEIMSFEHFVLHTLADRARRDPFFHSQSSYLLGSSGEVLVDAIYRLEDIDRRWSELCARAGISAALPHRNKSTRRDPLTWTTPMRACVHDIYGADFELFDHARSRPSG